ncbi:MULTISPECIES: FHA domain-containing protein [Alloscardovia]|jgi:oxoglutarate dehydrogenase inhibitor|uniref:FHA domain-containing protein n=2 Tax=Alloscardovia omnicolens TaxID=419015 RepID=A0A2I1M7E1_9BIFI|nr:MULTISPECIES: FHA domain-containing protein [Alloscardovia]ERH30204.1 putative oxoglutarate dehydrogenase inhibitor [Alloscardovia omnicolens F0580]KWZ73496.1 putative oxoglutarate dehydrogenase inhibitor [Alloscardovia omnicolens]MBS6346642.1 FHA domain-containing protein [Alloscardovia omnicolens]MDK6248913.1 FHA domain-containing protein [Alloscardovia omnicolens]MDK6250475.1 FHA domain-containing protein [Alloscardovia omnicolens]
MVISIPTAGETTSIGLPAITVPVTATGERPLTQEDMNTIAQLSDTSALLIATRGADGARYLLDADVITAGRDAASDIVLDDNTVSREHTIFKRSGSVFTVEDAGSLNGTYVNRERVDSARLNSGDEIIIGRFRFAFFTKSPAVVQ